MCKLDIIRCTSSNVSQKKDSLLLNKNGHKNKNRKTMPHNASLIIIIVVPILLIMSNTVSGHFVYVYAQNATTTISNNSNMTNVKIEGSNYPIKYNNTNAKVVSIVPQKEASKLVVTIEPTKDGKLTIDLPRQLIDYKIAGSNDGNYIVSINGKQVSTVKEISNTPSSRTLEIAFGGGDRTIEITGTQMAQAPVSAVKAQTEAAVKGQMAASAAANKTKESSSNATKNVGTNASQVKASASGSGSIVNKTVGALGNLTGGIKKLLVGK
jgi:hypothetical protein